MSWTEEMKIDCGDPMEYSKGMNETHPAYLATDNHECPTCGDSCWDVLELDEYEDEWSLLIKCVVYGCESPAQWIEVKQ